MPTPKLDPYVSFNGTCQDACHFYERVLGAKIDQLITFGSSPMAAHVSPTDANKVLHAKLTIDGQTLLASDTVPPHPYEGIKGFSLSIDYPTAAAAKKVFASLSEGGVVTVPIDKTFWAAAFGMVIDRFGVTWMVGCEKEG